MNKKVGIVVVTYNRLTLLKEVVEALRAQTYRDTQIIVVNNGSTDGTLDWLNDQSDILTITQGNVGGAGGFFTGMKYVAEHDYDYCWVMDDDVVCRPDALYELMEAYNVKPNIGYVCSKVIGIDGSPMNVPSVDMRPSENGYSACFEYLDKQMVKINNSTFVSLLLSTDMIREVGLPYKEYFIWGDDSEYTDRLSSKHDCYLAGKSIVVHKRSRQGSLDFMKETDPKRLQNYFYHIRNNDHNLHWKNMGRRARFFWWYDRYKVLFRLFRRGDKVHFKIMWNATKQKNKFNPQICYPEKPI